MVPGKDAFCQLFAVDYLVLFRAQTRFSFSRSAVQIKASGTDQGRVVGLCGGKKKPVAVLFQKVVAVHKGNILAPGYVQPRVSGAAEPPVFLVDYGDAAVLGRIAVAKAAGIIGGAVVHQDDFQNVLLPQYGVQTPGQEGGNIVYGDDHRNHSFSS